MSADPCRDCGVAVGLPHETGCVVARCLWTGQQRIQCDGGLAAECCKALRDSDHADLADELAYHLSLDDPDHDCGEDVWTGVWPGDADAIAMNVWVRWGPPWIACRGDHPDARPDLNALTTVGRWDREQKRWVKR